MGRKQGSCRRENLPFPKKWQANSEEQKTRCFPVGKRRTRPKCNRQSSSRTFILSPRKNAVLTAGLLTCTLEIEISASGSYLLTKGSSLCNGWLSPRQHSLLRNRPRAHSSGRVVFPFSCAGTHKKRAPVTVHRMVFVKFFTAGRARRFCMIIHEKRGNSNAFA